MFWYYLITLIILLLDQVTKWAIVSYMELYETRSVIGEFFYIASHRNRGAAFGILQDQRWFFIVVTIVVVVGLIVYLYKMSKEKQHLLCVALSFLLAGALGNFIDRVRTGEVVDFLLFRFQFNFFGKPIDYYFATFNVADAAITIGVILVLIDLLIQWRNEKRRGAEYDASQ